MAVADPADSRVAIVLAAVEGTVLVAEVAAGPAGVDTVRVAVEETVQVVAADREAEDTVRGAGREADSAEEDRAITVAGRFAASVLTISNSLITKIPTAFAGT